MEMDKTLYVCDRGILKTWIPQKMNIVISEEYSHAG